MSGFIKLYRDIRKWEWYTDTSVLVLFVHCLLCANHEDAKWRGIVIKRGSFVTSRAKLAKETGLTEMQIRTALKKLNLTSEITSKTTSEYSIITINNWDLYQQNNQVNNQRITSEQPASNQRITTNKNNKNEKNDKKEVVVVVNEENGKFYGEYGNVYLTKDNYDKLLTFTLDEKVLNDLINDLSAVIASKNDKYKPYDAEYPQAHYVHLKAFWKHRSLTGFKNSTQKTSLKVIEKEPAYNYGF